MNGEILLPPSAWDISIRKIRFSSRSFQPPQDAQTTTEVSFTIITSSVHVVITYVPRHPSWLSCLLQCQVLTTFHSPPLSPSNKECSVVGQPKWFSNFQNRSACPQPKAKNKGRLAAWHCSHPIYLSISTFFRRIEGLAWQPAPG